jgi:hypothetical protein
MAKKKKDPDGNDQDKPGQPPKPVENSPDYDIGYGKPPAHFQFKKGQSGNPKGRPKGSIDLSTAAKRIFREPVVINENGQRQTVTKLEATLEQVANKSASGDLRATRVMLPIEERIEESPKGTAPSQG